MNYFAIPAIVLNFCKTKDGLFLILLLDESEIMEFQYNTKLNIPKIVFIKNIYLPLPNFWMHLHLVKLALSWYKCFFRKLIWPRGLFKFRLEKRKVIEETVLLNITVSISNRTEKWTFSTRWDDKICYNLKRFDNVLWWIEFIFMS